MSSFRTLEENAFSKIRTQDRFPFGGPFGLRRGYVGEGGWWCFCTGEVRDVIIGVETRKLAGVAMVGERWVGLNGCSRRQLGQGLLLG